MASLSLVFDLIGRDVSASKAFRDVGDQAGRAGKEATGFGSSVGGAMKIAAGAIAAAGIGKAFAGFVQDAAESAKIGRLTAAVITSTGGAAKITADQVSALATSISNKTAVDDEAIQSASNLLLTFTKVRNETGKGNDIFNQATQAAVDMSVALGTDANGAALQLGKALNDPIKGVTALGRAGVSFTQQQKDQIKAMVEAGDTLGAQKIILAEMQTQFGGAAAAAASPLERLKVIAGNLGEQIGGALLPHVESFSNFIADKAIPTISRLWIWLGEKLGPVFGEIIGGIRAFGAAWTYNDGEITSSGFAGFLERLGYIARQIFGELTGGIKAFAAAWKFNDGEITSAGFPGFMERLGFIARTVFGEIIGGVRAFAAAWKYNDGEVTSSGFPGMMERIGYAARQTFDYVRGTVIPALADFAGWVKRNSDIILPFVAALGAGYVVFQTITAITRAWAAAQAMLNVVMTANPIGLVIVAIAALAAGLYVAYQKSETFREIVDKAFRAVAAAGSWMWDNVLKPVFGFMLDYWTMIARGIGWAWENLIRPAWTALSAYLTFMWNNVVKPYLGFVLDAWTAVARGIGWAYDNLIKPVWGFFSGALDGLRSGFSTTVDAIGRAWDGLKEKLAAPLRAVVTFVNDKVIGNLNKVTKVFGLTIPSLNASFATGGYTGDGGKYEPKGIVHAGEFVFTKEQTAAIGKGRLAALAESMRDSRTGSSDIGGPWDFAKGVGGKIADGAGNLVDAAGNVVGSVKDAVGSAVSWTGDKIEDLVSRGIGFALDKIIRPIGDWISEKVDNPFIRDFTKGVFGSTADHAKKWGNDRETGTVADGGGGMGGATFARGGPLGGNWASLFAAVKAVIPQARLNSGVRNTPDAHGRGKAVDFGFGTGPGGAGSPGLASIARYLYQNFKDSLYELIYTGVGGSFQLKNGRDTTYNAATRAGHTNHVHAAVYDQGGILPPGFTMAYNGTGKSETIRTAEQEAALSGPSVFHLYDSDGVLMGTMRGQAEAAATGALSAVLDRGRYNG